MNYFFKSIKAHTRNWKENNFEKTKAGKNLNKYKDIHKGESCFLIGNGPSLNADDLTKIEESGYKTFAFNRIYYIFNETSWRPTYYISQDEKMLEGCKEDVSKLELAHKFIPANLRWYYNINIQDAEEFYLEGVKDRKFWFSDNIDHSVCWASTVMYTAAQFAVYMGFSTIYLIGVDHHFHISKDKNGNIVVDNSVKDYFSEKYNHDKDNLVFPSPDISTETYYAMKKYCDERNINVYNTTRGGKLEVFPRMDVDSLLKKE